MLHTNVSGPGETNASDGVCVSDVHLDGSSLLFDDLIKLLSFYCISRYVHQYQFVHNLICAHTLHTLNKYDNSYTWI